MQKDVTIAAGVGVFPYTSHRNKCGNHLVDRGESDVVVQKLSKLHQHQGVPPVQVRHVSMNDDWDETGARQCFSTQGTEPWPRYGCKTFVKGFKCRRRMFIRLKIPTKWSRVVLRVKVLVNWLDKCHETVTTAATDQEDIQSLVYFYLIVLCLLKAAIFHQG